MADFRGYIQSVAPEFLGFVGNDVNGTGSTGINTDKLKQAGGVESNYTKSTLSPSAAVATINNLYRTYSSAQQPSGSYSAGAGTGSNNAGDLAYIDDQTGLLRNQLGRLGVTQSQGVDQISNDYNHQVSGVNAARSRSLADFTTKEQDTKTDKNNALDTVDTNARTLSNSVRQLIGAAGGSGSSAYQITAPGAVARKASTERSNVQDTFGRNIRDLSTSEKNAEEDYNSALADLARQKADKLSGLERDTLESQNDITGSLADLARQRVATQGGGYGAIRAASAPFTTDINNRNNAIDALYTKYTTPYNVTPVNAVVPTLADYTVDRAAVTAPGAGTADETYDSPYARFLRKTDASY